MSYKQRAEPCKEHAGCTVIHGVQTGGRIVSSSHLASTVPAETRANLDVPEVEDDRGRPTRWALMEEEHLTIVGHQPHAIREERRRLAFLAADNELITQDEASAAVGVSPEALEAEAREKKWIPERPARK